MRSSASRWLHRRAFALLSLVVVSAIGVFPGSEGASASTDVGTNKLVTSGAPGDIASSSAQANAPAGQDVVVFARSTNDESVPDGAAGFFVTVSNGGSAPTPVGQAIRLSLHIPEGMTFSSISDLSNVSGLASFPANAEAGASFVCPTSATAGGPGSVLSCTWGSASAGAIVPSPIGAKSSIVALVELKVAKDFPTTTGVTIRTLGVDLSDPGKQASTGTSTSADIAIVAGGTSPVFYPDVAGSTSGSLGQDLTESVHLLNIGSGPATSSPGHPTVTMGELLPPGLIGSWHVTSPAWSCTGAPTAAPSCSYNGASIAVGGFAPMLALSYQLDPAGVGKLGLVLGGAPNLQRWTIAIAGDTPNNAFKSSFLAQLAVLPLAGSNLQIRATVVGDVDQLLPGSTANVEAILSNVGAAPTSGKLSVSGTLPKGVQLIGAEANQTAPAAGASSALTWQCQSQAPDFSCTPSGEASLAVGASTSLLLHIGVVASASPADGTLSLRASAENGVAKEAQSSTSLPLFVLQNGTGFPSISLFDSSADQPVVAATDGAPVSLSVGGRFNERLDVHNSGGAPIAAGSVAQLVQTFTKGVKLQSALAPAGSHCALSSAKTPELRCTIAFSSALAPGSTMTGPLVQITDSEPTKDGTNWPAQIGLSGAKAPKASTIPVYVSIAGHSADVSADFVANLLPTAGGSGSFTLLVKNAGDAPSAGTVHIKLSLPNGVSKAELVGGKDLVCKSGTLSCDSTAKLAPGAQLPPIALSASFAANLSGKNLSLQASVAIGSSRANKQAGASMTIIPRARIHALIKAPDSVALDVEPLVSATEPITHTTVTLEGDGSGGNGLGLSYRWTQRCTSPAEVKALSQCHQVAPKVSWLNQPAGVLSPSTANVAFAAPAVQSITTLVFELEVSDKSASAMSFTSIKVVPPTSSAKGLSLDKPHPKVTSAGPATEVAKLPSPAEKLSSSTSSKSKVKTKSAFFGTPAHVKLLSIVRDEPTTTEPSTTAPAAPSTSSTTTTTTKSETTTTVASPSSSTEVPSSTTTPESASGSSSPESSTTSTTPSSSSTSSTTTTTPAGLPAALCDIVSGAINGKSFATSLGAVRLTLANLDTSSSSCSSSSTVSFSDSSIQLSSFLSATGVAGTVAKSGITFTAGTLTGPSTWHSPSFSLGTADGAKGLFIGFSSGTSSASDLAVTGSVSANGIPFLSLPTGWTGKTSLDFASAPGASKITLAVNGTGPSNDASPASAPPTVSIDGQVSNDGTFSLNANLKQMIQLQGSAINLSGKIEKKTAAGPITTTVTGTLGAPLSIVSGLTLNTMKVTVAPTDNSLGITGSGELSISTSSGAITVNVALSYSDPKDWSLTVSGGGTKAWTPIPGLSILPRDVRGSITATGDVYKLAIEITPSSKWTPTTGVSISNLSLKLSNVCPDSGAPCPKDASLFLQAGGSVALSLPVVGDYSGSLSGVLALPSGAFSVDASLPRSISLGAGITITAPKFSMSLGMPSVSSEAQPSFDGSSNKDGLSSFILGGLSIPKIGSLPTVDAAWSKLGWALAAPLGNYSLPGSSGAGSKLSSSVLGWASFATSINITNPLTKLVTKIPIPKDILTISGGFDAPDWLTTLLKLPKGTSGEASGSFDSSNGNFNLKMTLPSPGNIFLFGSSSSSTNLRLTSTFLSLDRTGADFNIALGGLAKLNIGSGSASASSIDLSVALGYAASSQTVAGTLSLSSANGWSDAFGLNGLTLFDLAVSFQLNLATLVPGLGIGARAVLPATTRAQLGMPSAATTTVVANMTVSNPCLGLQIDNPANPTANVLDLGSKGVLTARQFRLEIAPNGCTVGQFKYAPGVSLNFDGAVLGVSLLVAAHLSTSPFAFDASIDVGDFSVGGVTIDHTHLAIAYKSSDVSVEFAGGIRLFGTGITVTGAYAKSGATSTVDLSGKVDSLTLASSLSVKNVAVSVHVVTGTKPTTTFAAKGLLELLGSKVETDFTLGVVNGQLNTLNAKTKASISIASDAVHINADFTINYGPGVPLLIDGKGDVSVNSYKFASATILVKPTQVDIGAMFSVPNVFSASLKGALYSGAVPAGTMISGPNNTTVAARTGDFYFSATDVSLKLAGFSTTGSVKVGRANNNVWGALGASLQLTGTGSGNAVTVAGSFSGTGDYSLAGSGSLDLLGIKATVDVKAAGNGSQATVTGASTLSVLGSNLAVSGTFSNASGTPRFRLAGTGNLNAGGYNLASAKFNFSNFPEDAGLSATINTNFASVVTLAGRLNVIGGTKYYFGANINLNLRVLSVPASVVLTNCTNSSCSTAAGHTTLAATATISSSGFSFGVSVSIGSNGVFSATAVSPANGSTYSGQTGELSLAVVSFYAKFTYSMKLTISNASPYVSLLGTGSAGIWGHSWSCSVGFWHASCGWGGWSQLISVSGSISTNPTRVCASASVWKVSFSKCI